MGEQYFDPELLGNYASNGGGQDEATAVTPDDLIDFESDEQTPGNHIIKVIGVGGGGSNAVTNMYKEKIKDVDFVICNTDKQALRRSPVPIKIQLGSQLTSGLGAGNDPRTGRDAARESLEEIKKILSDGTKMVFITAGMGGGTGTGAAPVIASVAKEMDILTVAIVTLPFRFEGPKRLQQAIEGINELQKSVDALLLIDNERIQEVYGESPAIEAFKKADEVLTIAAKGIADIINYEGIINVDFADVRNILKDSGIAIMGTGYGEGENRAVEAAKEAIHSPLLNFLNIKGAKNLLFNISYNPEDPLITNEIKAIANYIQAETGNIPDTIWGYIDDPKIEKGKISVTVIATGFNANISEYLDDLMKDFKQQLDLVDDKIDIIEPEIPNKQPQIEFPEHQPEKNQVEPSIFENPREIVELFEQSPLEFSNLEDIKELEATPAFKRFGYKVEIKTLDRDYSKHITLVKR